MHLLIRLALILVVSVAIAGAVRPAAAQKPAAPVIIVVDLRKIEREARPNVSFDDLIPAPGPPGRYALGGKYELPDKSDVNKAGKGKLFERPDVKYKPSV